MLKTDISTNVSINIPTDLKIFGENFSREIFNKIQTMKNIKIVNSGHPPDHYGILKLKNGFIIFWISFYDFIEDYNELYVRHITQNANENKYNNDEIHEFLNKFENKGLKINNGYSKMIQLLPEEINEIKDILKKNGFQEWLGSYAALPSSTD